MIMKFIEAGLFLWIFSIIMTGIFNPKHLMAELCTLRVMLDELMVVIASFREGTL